MIIGLPVLVILLASLLIFILLPGDAGVSDRASTIIKNFNGAMQIFSYLFIAPLIVIASKKAITGEGVTISNILSTFKSRIIPFILTSLMIAIIVFSIFVPTVILIGLQAARSIVAIPLIIGVIVVIYFGVFWSFVDQSVLLSKKSGIGALAHSKSLVNGRWRKLFAIGFIIGILGAVISSLMQSATAFYLMNDLQSSIFNLSIEELIIQFPKMQILILISQILNSAFFVILYSTIFTVFFSNILYIKHSDVESEDLEDPEHTTNYQVIQ